MELGSDVRPTIVATCAIVFLALTSSRASAHCWILDKLYPVTTEALVSQHLTFAQQEEIRKWTSVVSQVDRPKVRWMRDPYDKTEVFVIRTTPIPPSGFTIWGVLNKQFVINPGAEDCYIRGDMMPRVLPTGTYPPLSKG